MAVAALLAACGGESSSDANEKAGTYEVGISADARFDRRGRWIGFKKVRLAS